MSVALKCKPTVYMYNINGVIIVRVKEIKDLGIIIQANLSSDSHISSSIAKANHMLGLIKRTVEYTAPVNVKLQLYKSLVRRRLEYCTQAWNGLNVANRSKLERVQPFIY